MQMNGPGPQGAALEMGDLSRDNEGRAIQAVAEAIQARLLQTYLTNAEWVDSAEDARGAAARLRAFTFDQAPAGTGLAVEGFVLTDELARAEIGATAGSLLHRLDASHVVSASAPVLPVLESLAAGGRMVFVVDGREVSGFITDSDLNKHPVRTHFYLLLSSLEAALAAWVRREFPDLEAAVGLLGDDAGKVRRRYRRDQRANVALDFVTGMDLSHLLTIVGGGADGRSLFGPTDHEAWDLWVDSLKGLRDAVMHSVIEFLRRDRTADDLLHLERDLRAVLARARRVSLTPIS